MSQTYFKNPNRIKLTVGDMVACIKPGNKIAFLAKVQQIATQNSTPSRRVCAIYSLESGNDYTCPTHKNEIVILSRVENVGSARILLAESIRALTQEATRIINQKTELTKIIDQHFSFD